MADPLVALRPGAAPLVETHPGWVEPLEALEGLRGRRHPVLLLSGLDSHPSSRYSILAADPLLVLAVRGEDGMVTWGPGWGRDAPRRVRGDPFDLLRAIAPGTAAPAGSGLPFAGGAIGYLGYGLRRWVEPQGARLPERPPLPEAWFGVYDAAAVFDHVERRVLVQALPAGEDRAAEQRARAGLARLGRLLRDTRGRGAPRRGPDRGDRRAARLGTSPAGYQARVARALDYIAAGDVYQVNLSHRIECEYEGDPMALFSDLATRNPAPFAAYLDAGAFAVVSASPERFVSLRGQRALSSPIKGTRPRGADAGEDRRLAQELLSSPKDRAENVMIADLVRNDLGRVSETGSVEVRTLCGLESFATVHHLVSTVAGSLRADRDRVDLLRALFPGGSMTGAPKIRAMQVIDELEGEERGIYAGGLGYLSFDGSADFSIVIRTLVCAGGRAYLRVGGGIVAESQPEAEYRETLDKARALLEALRAEIRIPG